LNFLKSIITDKFEDFFKYFSKNLNMFAVNRGDFVIQQQNPLRTRCKKLVEKTGTLTKMKLVKLPQLTEI